MSINSIQELDILTEAIILQEQFDLDKPPNSWIMQFILQLFDLFFLPIILTVFFLILTAPWFLAGFNRFIANDFISYLCRGLLFLGVSYVIIHIYIVNVVRQQEDTFNPLLVRQPR